MSAAPPVSTAEKLKIDLYDANIETESVFVPNVGEVEVAKVAKFEFDVVSTDTIELVIGRNTTVIQAGSAPAPA